MVSLYGPGPVHALVELRDDETGDTIQVDVSIYDHEAITIAPLKDGDSLAIVKITFTDGSLLVEMGGPSVEMVKSVVGDCRRFWATD